MVLQQIDVVSEEAIDHLAVSYEDHSQSHVENPGVDGQLLLRMGGCLRSILMENVIPVDFNPPG